MSLHCETGRHIGRFLHRDVIIGAKNRRDDAGALGPFDDVIRANRREQLTICRILHNSAKSSTAAQAAKAAARQDQEG